jgi:methyl-accepting chemotaxis protein
MNKIAFNFAYDSNGHNIANIEIPSNALKLSKDHSKIFLQEVSSSLLHNSSLYNNSAEFLFNISNSIYGSEGVLNFENSVMSPVFKFYSKEENIEFKFPGKINIVHNEYEASSLYYYDYCLAKLNGFDLTNDKFDENSENKGWECVERQTKEGQTEFTISEFGVYAVILNPLRNKANYFSDSATKNFFLENVKIILIVLAVVIVVIAVVFYIFSRVTRYRKKYHANREKIMLLKQQREEYENMTTDIFGQTLGDNMNGIVYKANPAYTVTDEIKKAGTSLEDEIEKLQIECKNVSEQNERLQKDIEEVTKKYEELSESIENMNK